MDKEPIGISNGAAKNLYEELVYAHQQQHMAIHQAASFLPWHRYYTHLFSRLLRQECGYQAPFPWWDETKDSGNFTNSGLFTPEYFGTLRTVSQEGQGSCVTDGVSNLATPLIPICRIYGMTDPNDRLSLDASCTLDPTSRTPSTALPAVRTRPSPRT